MMSVTIFQVRVAFRDIQRIWSVHPSYLAKLVCGSSRVFIAPLQRDSFSNFPLYKKFWFNIPITTCGSSIHSSTQIVKLTVQILYFERWKELEIGHIPRCVKTDLLRIADIATTIRIIHVTNPIKRILRKGRQAIIRGQIAQPIKIITNKTTLMVILILRWKSTITPEPTLIAYKRF